MKTPKRKISDFYKCPKCGAYVLSTDNPFNTVLTTACPECGTKVFVICREEQHALAARWKCKNREARLRNRIRVGLYHQMMEKYWKDCTMDCLEALTMREDMDGTYGQDIEGS